MFPDRPCRDGAPGTEPRYVPPTALYIHVPVCASKCSYCDFYSVAASSLSPSYERALVEATLVRAGELAERFGADRFDTVYIGGGTPSMLSVPSLDRLLGGVERLARSLSGRGPSEWTVEANPDSLDARGLEIMKRHGVTRLSIGVQSLDPDELAILGRRHGREAALDAVRLANDAGMSVSADLIAGVPAPKDSRATPGDGDRLASYARELLDAGATHISAYDLSLEDGTPLAASRDRLRFPDEDRGSDQRRSLEACLRESGMRRYEISNFAAIGKECRHNLAYWRMDSYVGAGPGAVSTVAECSGESLRIEEPRSISGYGADAKAAETRIDFREAAFETIMMAFRTSFGLDLASFRSRFGIEAEELIGETMARWSDRLIPGESWPGREESGGPALTGEGMDILNRYLVDCLREIEGKMPNIAVRKADNR